MSRATSEILKQKDWTWLQLQVEYIKNPQQFTEEERNRIEAQSGPYSMGAAALVIATENLQRVVDLLETKCSHNLKTRT